MLIPRVGIMYDPRKFSGLGTQMQHREAADCMLMEDSYLL